MDPEENPDLMCAMCNTLMVKCNLDPERFTFRALFTLYTCGNKPQCKALPHHLKKSENPEDKHDKRRQIILKVMCNICSEYSDCYVSHSYDVFCIHHVGHVYKKIADNWDEHLKEHNSRSHAKPSQKYPPGMFTMQYYEKNKKNIIKADGTELDFYTEERKILWKNCSSELKTFTPAESKYISPWLYDCIRQEYGAAFLTMKKDIDGPSLCILCESAYTENPPSEVIYNHFIECVERYKIGIRGAYINRKCAEAKNRSCVGKIMCEYCTENKNKPRKRENRIPNSMRNISGCH